MESKEAHFEQQRHTMVAQQIELRSLHNPRLLEVFRNVPRHCFVPEEYQHSAYEDRPLLIGESQTISQPYIVALMTNLLHLKGDETVLEIGTGSGYQAAILSRLAKQVVTIERHASLAKQAAKVLADLAYDNVKVIEGDGSGGCPEEAPYDGIMVTAAAPEIPKPLLDQLKEGGRLVIPVGGVGMQYLQTWQRKGSHFTHEDIVPVAFVPLRGEHGWENDWYNR